MLTEVEMREFFDRVVSQVNQLTGTAAQVEGLQSQVNELRTRISQLEADNAQLRGELNEAHTRTSELESNLGVTQSQLDSERAVTQGLRDTIVQRDSIVVELNGQVKSETDAHRITRADLDDARRAVQEWESNYNTTKDQLSSVTAQRDEWHARADSLQAENHELKSKLDKISAMFQSNVSPFPAQAAS
jgi:chromosome segregation ATPase